jgi:hypothetical protein
VHCVDELLLHGLLEHVAEHPGLDRLPGVGGIRLHRQYDDGGVGRGRKDVRDGGERAAAGHVEVEHEHVGLVAAHVADRGLDVARLGYDLEVVLGIEEQAQGAADDRMVIGKNDAYRLPHPR